MFIKMYQFQSTQGTSEDAGGIKKQNIAFNNFEQRDDDMDIIEKKLLGR